MRTSTFTHDFLLLFSGPLIWAVHFVAIYSFNGILCARTAAQASWLGVGIATWGIGGAGILAIAAIAACLAVEPRGAPDSHGFVRWVTIGLGWLAIVAIVWETLPVFLVPACGMS